MTNPTDPRIEAAARALCAAAGYSPDDNYITPRNFPEMDVNWKVYAPDAEIAIKAADESAWLPIESAPGNQKLKLAWRGKDGEWRFEFGMAMWDWRLGDYRSGVSTHHAATHWQPLPKPPETR